MSETPEVNGTTGPAAEDRKVEAPQMFILAMSKYSQAFEIRDFAECLNWLKQAESLAENHAEAISAHREAYARLITACASKSITLALHTGNILKEHRELAEYITRCAGALVDKFPEADSKKAKATVIVGYAAQLTHRLQRVMVLDTYVTTAEKLDGVLDNLFDILNFSTQLDSASDEALPGICDRLALAATAASNAECSLPWFFPRWWADWDKAELYCRRAVQWLKHNNECPGKVDPHFDECDEGNLLAVVDSLEKAAEALKLHQYKRSKKLLKSAEAALAETTCV